MYSNPIFFLWNLLLKLIFYITYFVYSLVHTFTIVIIMLKLPVMKGISISKLFHKNGLGRLPSYKHISKIFLKTTIRPPFHYDHLPTQVLISPYRLKDSEYAIISVHFLGVWFLQTRLSQQNKKLELWNINSIFFFFRNFFYHDLTKQSLYFFGKNIHNSVVGKLPC